MFADIIHFHHRRLLCSSPENRGEGEREGLPGLLARRRRGTTSLLAIGRRRSAVREGETELRGEQLTLKLPPLSSPFNEAWKVKALLHSILPCIPKINHKNKSYPASQK
nr:hypothetical protein Iba_chr07aCG13230 [Ipomoea batatas]GMD18283.1 hypothetical protein Iba_chr07dCG11800 [Ipomoea batatas]GMD61376.1 hypothetical protein Iba_chr12aCG20300 [Ipomoea batatas]